MHVIVSYLIPLCFALVPLVVRIYSFLGQPPFSKRMEASDRNKK